jgi:DNA-binding protein
MDFQCEICGYRLGEKIKKGNFYSGEESLINYPFYLPNELVPQPTPVKKVFKKVYFCPQCGAITYRDDFNIDWGNYSVEKYIPYEPQEIVDILFLKRNNVDFQNVLEIGGFNLSFTQKLLKTFGKNIEKIFVIEPSREARKALDSLPMEYRKRIYLIEETFPLKRNSSILKGLKFTLVIIRNTLELVKNLKKFLEPLKYLMAENGKILITVPYYLLGLRKNFFYTSFERKYEFSPLSLEILFQNLDMSLEDFQVGLYMTFLFGKANKERAQLNGGFLSLKTFWKPPTKDYVKNLFLANFSPSFEEKELIIWGAGRNIVNLVNVLQEKFIRVIKVVDINKNKQGLYIPGTKDLKVEAPEVLKSLDRNIPILINSSAKTEIKRTAQVWGFKKFLSIYF